MGLVFWGESWRLAQSRRPSQDQDDRWAWCWLAVSVPHAATLLAGHGAALSASANSRYRAAAAAGRSWSSLGDHPRTGGTGSMRMPDQTGTLRTTSLTASGAEDTRPNLLTLPCGVSTVKSRTRADGIDHALLRSRGVHGSRQETVRYAPSPPGGRRYWAERPDAGDPALAS